MGPPPDTNKLQQNTNDVTGHKFNRKADLRRFGNRVWVNPSHKSHSYNESPTFSRQTGWGRDDENDGRGARERNPRRHGGGGGGFDTFSGFSDTGSSRFNFTNQNKFSHLNTQQECNVDDQEDETETLLSMIKKDMESWEQSGQWLFSCYSVAKDTSCLTGFQDFSPEELRFEYCTALASGNLQAYASSVQQLLSQQKTRIFELKAQNSATRVPLIAELKHYGQQGSSSGFDAFPKPFVSEGFGSTLFSSTENTTSNSFNFKSDNIPQNPGFSKPLFGSSTGFPSQPSFGSATSHAFGNTSSSPSVASFSFALPAEEKSQPVGFGSVQPSGFGSSSVNFKSSSVFSAPPSATSGFGAAAALAEASSAGMSGTSSNVFGSKISTTPSTVALSTTTPLNQLFTPQSELTEEELKEFQAKRFTLGKIPLKPPPKELLIV
ncbi:nucleoporin NUP42 [Polypterus senegalus]|uniref:nucleoporin NUP42 n=1 Tax=Polypterus senegalus TaxID=55291 RepID=UPI001965A7B2|nr:nucleoporin NUP42 [Polypterus senegalus]